MGIGINCDMGESFGLYKLGEDEDIISYITEANIACGFHASDPNHMRASVDLARRYGVNVGAHFSLPDLQGFGRREMTIGREEMVNIITYQVGALRAFLKMYGMPLSHMKPHGALYGMAARLEHVAQAVADVCELYQVPVFGMTGTVQEEIYQARGLEFRAEFFADLDYNDDGELIITREHVPVDPSRAAERCRRAVTKGEAESVNGTLFALTADTICLHSDTPNVVEVAKAVRDAMEPYLQ